MEVDLADVAVIADLKTKTLAWIVELQTAVPALRRLEAAGFAGIDWIFDQLPGPEPSKPFADESPWALVNALETTRLAGGDEFTLEWLIEMAPRG